MDIEEWKRAGNIARRVLEETAEKMKVGDRLYDIAEAAEKKIYEYGARPAFPTNISINSFAAHYTPSFDDKTVIPENAVVKLDVGAHVNGAIGDTALTIDFSGKYGKMMDANKKALEVAINNIKEGIEIGEIGRIIEEVVKNAGFRTISNLTGHQLKKYQLHGGVSIPNIAIQSNKKLIDGDIIAIEPFVTGKDNFGRVKDKNSAEIFSLEGKIPCRLKESKKMLEYIEKNYNALPFAERWLHKEFKSYIQTRAGLSELLRNGSLHAYPILEESSGGVVTQFEHTVLVKKDGCEVLTKN